MDAQGNFPVVPHAWRKTASGATPIDNIRPPDKKVGVSAGRTPRVGKGSMRGNLRGTTIFSSGTPGADRSRRAISSDTWRKSRVERVTATDRLNSNAGHYFLEVHSVRKALFERLQFFIRKLLPAVRHTLPTRCGKSSKPQQAQPARAGGSAFPAGYTPRVGQGFDAREAARCIIFGLLTRGWCFLGFEQGPHAACCPAANLGL